MTLHQKDTGFTLLEIMLAMLVLGIVVSMISISLSGSIKVIDATMEQGELYYRAQVAIERISEDLTSALLSENIEFIGGAEGNADSQSILLSFASMAHIVFDVENGQPGTGIISYAIQPDAANDQHLLLLRSDVLYRPHGDGEGDGNKDATEEAFLLCDRLRSVEFSFIDHNGEKLESWDTTVNEGDEKTERRLPTAVSCRLEFWINEAEERTVTFQTTVLLPTGLMQAEPKEDAGAA